MKKGILVGLLCAIACIMSAQIVYDNELAIVYYMPQTQLCFDVEYEEVTTRPGLFAQYAEQYLGKTDIVREEHTSYRIVRIRPFTKTIADFSRAYKVMAENGIESQLLSLTDIGTPAGYNIESACKKTKPERPKCDKPQLPPMMPPMRPMVMPLLEEHLTGKNIAQQAQGAAKLIYRIRENRMYLIGGEVDKAPADGKAMQLVLEELDKQERQLVELFIGHREVKKHHTTLYYTPVKTEEVEIGYFSEKEGITTSGSGEPIVLNITARRLNKGSSRSEKENKKAPQPSQIFYNLPGSANYKVVYLNETMAEAQTSVAQFGVAVPLARDLFTQKQLPHIYFDTETGNIKSIYKQNDAPIEK